MYIESRNNCWVCNHSLSVKHVYQLSPWSYIQTLESKVNKMYHLLQKVRLASLFFSFSNISLKLRLHRFTQNKILTSSWTPWQNLHWQTAHTVNPHLPSPEIRWLSVIPFLKQYLAMSIHPICFPRILRKKIQAKIVCKMPCQNNLITSK